MPCPIREEHAQDEAEEAAYGEPAQVKSRENNGARR
jgi:hypothetical protein